MAPPWHMLEPKWLKKDENKQTGSIIVETPNQTSSSLQHTYTPPMWEEIIWKEIEGLKRLFLFLFCIHHLSVSQRFEHDATTVPAIGNGLLLSLPLCIHHGRQNALSLFIHHGRHGGAHCCTGHIRMQKDDEHVKCWAAFLSQHDNRRPCLTQAMFDVEFPTCLCLFLLNLYMYFFIFWFIYIIFYFFILFFIFLFFYFFIF